LANANPAWIITTAICALITPIALRAFLRAETAHGFVGWLVVFLVAGATAILSIMQWVKLV